MIRPALAVLTGLILVASADTRPDTKPEPADKTKNPPADAPLKLPKEWDPKDPLPIVKGNCVRCHLTAGRELTAPLRDFARSVHDLAHLTCSDCHGGDTENDATAHESEHGFIGTKMSAHMAACASCHPSEAKSFATSKHYRDLSKGINRDYPVCLDCHGNHDIGRPPPGFSMTNVCSDCHKKFEKDFPLAAAVVAENDRLSKVLLQVHAKNKDAAEPTPAAFIREVAKVRVGTAKLMHHTDKLSADETKTLNARAHKLADSLEEWLRTQK
jgi:hypothetical protein